jgi:hypothetical protein
MELNTTETVTVSETKIAIEATMDVVKAAEIDLVEADEASIMNAALNATNPMITMTILVRYVVPILTLGSLAMVTKTDPTTNQISYLVFDEMAVDTAMAATAAMVVVAAMVVDADTIKNHTIKPICRLHPRLLTFKYQQLHQQHHPLLLLLGERIIGWITSAPKIKNDNKLSALKVMLVLKDNRAKIRN